MQTHPDLQITELQIERSLPQLVLPNKQRNQERNGFLSDILSINYFVFSQASNLSYAEQAKNTIEVNFFGIVNVSHSLFPLLNPHSR